MFNDVMNAVNAISEQRRIVAKVEQLMALVDELETHLAASRASAANLLKALVAKLTTQSKPSDRTKQTKSPAEKIIPMYADTDDDLLKAAEPAATYNK